MMTLKELKGVGRMLASFLLLFSSCFRSLAGRKLLRVSVQGLLSDVQRKNCEAIALEFDTCPRTLQRFLESIKWDEQMLRDRCQQIVVRDHCGPEAIGLIDESGIGKSGHHTAGVARQYNGNRGKMGIAARLKTVLWEFIWGTQRPDFRRSWTAVCICRSNGLRTRRVEKKRPP